jgi:DNA-binding response OmpR family regulator
MKILLADDDPETLELARDALGEYGYRVIGARDGAQALRRWEMEQPDLVVVDANLPGANGFDVCRAIRQKSRTPVIVLGKQNAERDVVRGFQAGADDFVAKPFSHVQLAMRVRAVLTRSRGSAEDKPVPQILVGKLTLDLESHEIRNGQRTVRLTPIEFRLLYLLALNAGRVVNTTQLIDYAWTYEKADPSMLKIHITRIRGKLRELGADPAGLKSIRWVGYSLANPTAADAVATPAPRADRAARGDTPPPPGAE